MEKALEILNQQLRDETLWLDSHEEAIKELEALQSRSCKGCKYLDKGTYGICPIAEPLMRQWLNYNEDTFCCNRHIPKDTQ